MPQRTSTGQAVPRQHGSGRGARRRYNVQNRRFRRSYRQAAPVRQRQQQSYRRYHRQQVGPARNVGKAINRKVQREQRVKAKRARIKRAAHQKQIRVARKETLRNKSLRALYNERLTPDLVDSAIRRGIPYRNAEKWGRYNAMAERLWGEAAPLLGAKGEDMPEIRHANTLFTGSLAGKRKAYAYVQDDGGDIARVLGKPKLAKRRVHVSKAAYLSGGKKRKKQVPLRYSHPKDRKMIAQSRKRWGHDAETVLLHEWAHTRQPFAGREKWETEGGAEEWARSAAKKLGYNPSPSHSKAYARYARQVRKKKGKRWIKRGQFKPG